MKIAILGNGFDLFHGMKTKLSDFLNFLESKNSQNIWFLYFKEINVFDRWVDFEKEIALVFNFIDINTQHHMQHQKFSLKYWKKDYQNDLNAFVVLWNQYFVHSIPLLKSVPNKKIFISEERNSNNLLADDQGYLIKSFYERNNSAEVFEKNVAFLIEKLDSLKELLIHYFYSEEKQNILMKEKIYKLFFKTKRLINEEDNEEEKEQLSKLLSFSFNYSDKTSNIYFEGFPHSLMETKDIYKNFHIYGELNKKNIVFGSNLISKQTHSTKIATLRKEYQSILNNNLIDMKAIFVDEILEEVTDVIIMGNSISSTDWWFYRELLLLLNFFKFKPNFIIFYHNEEEKKEKIINLLAMDSNFVTNVSREQRLIWKKYSEYK